MARWIVCGGLLLFGWLASKPLAAMIVGRLHAGRTPPIVPMETFFARVIAGLSVVVALRLAFDGWNAWRRDQSGDCRRR